MAEPAESGKSTAAKVTVTPASSGTGDFVSQAKYKRVIFDSKSNPNDTNDVVISVEGFALKAQRNIETIVPDFILEAADHATYVKYTIRPGEGRKIGEKIRKFPYKVIGDATFAEFKKALVDGTKKTRDAVSTHGLNIPVEKSTPQNEE